MTPSHSTLGSINMPFGKYKGQSLDTIAKTDRGLLYLDWLVGQTWLKGNLKNDLTAYLQDPAIADEIKRLVKEDEE